MINTGVSLISSFLSGLRFQCLKNRRIGRFRRVTVANDTAARAMSVSTVSKKATFAMGCFWAPDTVFGCITGILRTQVGYCGGSKPHPTYRDLGDHTESIDLDYDPKLLTYKQLLKLFWDNHEPTTWNKTQYMSAIFYRDDEERNLAEESKSLIEKELKKSVATKILPLGTFYKAESYHQKYYLQTFHSALFESLGFSEEDLITSTVAAKLNSYITGHSTVEAFNKEVHLFGLSPEFADYVREQIKAPNFGSCAF